jgi:hypothetical protein
VRRPIAHFAAVSALSALAAGCSGTPHEDIPDAGAEETSTSTFDAAPPANDSADASIADLGLAADAPANAPDALASMADALTDAPDAPLPTAYDDRVLAAHPVAYWTMGGMGATEPDRTGHGHAGSYHGTPATTPLPNGDSAAGFDGATQYLSIPSSAAFSIPTTGNLTWEAWLKPAVLQFPHDDGSSGYVDWMGKCDSYSPTCEWESRMYDTTTKEVPNRPNRFSAYVFNPSAGLGSAADWQPSAGLIHAGTWYHVVGEYTTKSQPAGCPASVSYPGAIDIWVDGVRWDQAAHGTTGCMSQYSVVPKAGASALNVGTMAKDSWFSGAIGKVAIYDYLLAEAEIRDHYTRMTGAPVSGSCAATCSF